jgi:hypothetical protein
MPGPPGAQLGGGGPPSPEELVAELVLELLDELVLEAVDGAPPDELELVDAPPLADVDAWLELMLPPIPLDEEVDAVAPFNGRSAGTQFTAAAAQVPSTALHATMTRKRFIGLSPLLLSTAPCRPLASRNGGSVNPSRGARFSRTRRPCRPP